MLGTGSEDNNFGPSIIIINNPTTSVEFAYFLNLPLRTCTATVASASVPTAHV